ncbi:MAG TPA: FliM/FliN family flagellar motor switch protein [Steroidobacter sp.]
MNPTATEIELEPLADAPADGRPLVESVLPLLGAVKVRVSVRVGAAQTSVAELLDMKQGAVLTLDRLVDQPLDVLIDEHVVARGVLVAVGENFGVRITEAASATAAASAVRS